MKIAVISHLDYPIAQPFYGGLEAHTWHLCHTLINRGHTVSLFASGDSDPTLNLVPVVPVALKLANSHSQGCSDDIKRLLYAHILDILRTHNFDVVHNNSLNPLPVLTAHQLRSPMLTVLHTPPFEPLASAVAVPCRPAVQYLTVSYTARKQWRQYAHSQVVYNGIDLAQWQFSPQPQSGWAIWFGRFVPEKRPHLAIESALAAGLKIKIAGPISDYEYFQADVLPKINGETVVYLNHLSHAQLCRELGQAAVFIHLPQWEEPYGLVYAEALACGTPVVTCRNGAGAEILDASCGRIADDNLSLKRAIREAARLSRSACRDRAESFCCIEAMVDAYEQHYQSLAVAWQKKTTSLPLVS